MSTCARAAALAAVGIASLLALAACGDARHEPVRVIAQPRAEAPPPAVTAAPVPAAAQPVASAPAAPPAVPPSSPPPRGLDAAPPPGLVSNGPPQRLWQPGQPNGNADFRAALEARQNARGQPAAQP